MFSLIVTGKMSGVDPQAWLGNVLAHRRPSGSSARRVAVLDVTGFRDLGPNGVTMHVNKVSPSRHHNQTRSRGSRRR
jgi:hypothetical protein